MDTLLPPELAIFYESLYRKQFEKVCSNPDHHLFTLGHERQSKSRDHSDRQRNTFLTGADTAFRSKTFRMYKCRDMVFN